MISNDLALIPRAGVTDLRALGLNERQIEALLISPPPCHRLVWAEGLNEREMYVLVRG